MTVDDVRRLWPEILTEVKDRHRTAHALLESAAATVQRLDGGVLYLGTRHETLARMISEAKNIDVLRAALRTVLGVDWRVRCEASDGGAEAPTHPTTVKRSTESPGRAAPGGVRPSQPPPEDPEDEPDIDADDDPTGAPYEVIDPAQQAVALLRDKLGARPLEQND